MSKATEETLARIRKIRHVVMDMDGTIYRGKQLFPTTKPFLELLDKYGIGYTFLTNNSSRSKKVYLDHLEEFGIHIEGSQMYTSTVNTVHYLQKFHQESQLWKRSDCQEFLRLFLPSESCSQKSCRVLPVLRLFCSYRYSYVLFMRVLNLYFFRLYYTDKMFICQ